MIAAVRRLAVAGLAVLAVAGAAACTSGAPSLRARPPVTATASQVVDGSYTAALLGKRVTLMVPSGRVDLVLTVPTAEVPAQNVTNAAPLVAAKGQTLVGVSWVLQRAAYPDSPNRQLTDPSDIFGVPQPVRLWLVTDGTRHEIPHVATLAAPYHRPGTAVWVSVPVGVRRWQFQLDYDGVTQTVDARTGKVMAGRAAPLYRALPLDRRGTCTAGRDDLTSCIAKYATGYPYVAGVGWAPAGKTWLLLQIVVEDNFDGAADATVAGAKPRAEIGKDPEQFSPFLVAARARSLAIGGTVLAVPVDGPTKRVALGGRLGGASS